MKRFSLLLLVLLALPALGQSAPHSVTLNWTPAVTGSAATGFNVKRGTTATGPFVTVGTTTAPTSTYVDPFQTTDEGKTFFYVVSATNAGGESSDSAVSNAALIPFSAPSTPGAPTVTVK